MVYKWTNKDKDFYRYMGKFFGSRIVEKQTNDRMYDDDNKIWYIVVKNERVIAFASIVKNTIKNIYSTNSKCLEEVLEEIQKDMKIGRSIVTNLYKEQYEKCKFQIDDIDTYRNFIAIHGKEEIEIINE